jgi:hypothetical protein
MDGTAVMVGFLEVGVNPARVFRIPFPASGAACFRKKPPASGEFWTPRAFFEFHSICPGAFFSQD